jgi:hypothetical protein
MESFNCNNCDYDFSEEQLQSLDIESIPYYMTVSKNEYEPPINQWFACVHTDLDTVTMGRVIGRDGSVFNAICHQTGADYIWYQRDQSLIEIWGPEEVVPIAKARVQERLDKIKNQCYPKLSN